jgi:hypothetical protein
VKLVCFSGRDLPRPRLGGPLAILAPSVATWGSRTVCTARHSSLGFWGTFSSALCKPLRPPSLNSLYGLNTAYAGKSPGNKLQQYKSGTKFWGFNVSGWKIKAKEWLLR